MREASPLIERPQTGQRWHKEYRRFRLDAMKGDSNEQHRRTHRQVRGK